MTPADPDAAAEPTVDRGLWRFAPDVYSQKDLPGVEREAHGLASLIASQGTTLPLSIGLFGQWGSGKTFFMRQIQDQQGRQRHAGKPFLRESTMCVARRTATLRRVRVTDSGKARSGSIKAVKGWVFHPQTKRAPARSSTPDPQNPAACSRYPERDDGWTHTIEIDDALSEEGPRLACLDGARACPPEDCGGVDGYRHLLDVLFDPTHEEFDDSRLWVGPAFEPEGFDLRLVNLQLERQQYS